MITKRINESQVFHVIARSLNVAKAIRNLPGPSYTQARISRSYQLRNEILSDFSVMGKVPVIHNCEIVMRAQGEERQFFIVGDSRDIDNNLIGATHLE